MIYTIPRWDNGRQLWRCEAASLRDAAEQAVRCDAHLYRADLRGADLVGARLAGAHMREATLTGAYLSGADLARADLRYATIARADLRGAILDHADLRYATIDCTSLAGARVAGADFGEATLLKALSDGELVAWLVARGATEVVPRTSESESESACIALLWQWCATYGRDLCPGLLPDTYGEGMREAKAQVRAIIRRAAGCRGVGVLAWLTERGIAAPDVTPRLAHEWPAGATWRRA